MDAVLDHLGFAGATVTELTGGMANTVCVIHRPDEPDVVLKTTATVPEGLYAAEAEGLEALAPHIPTPAVLDVGPRWLLMEALHPAGSDDEFWAKAGRAIAALHDVPGDRYGWESDGWLGVLPQRNPWHDDGFEFFATHRVLRYVGEPKAEAVMTTEDRVALERLCANLPSLLPAAPPALTHGDLWQNNVVATAAGDPAFIDPAVSWMWPELDLSMMYCTNQHPPAFFDAYLEARPLPSGWRDRMPILHLRELMCILAHEGDRWNTLDKLRDTVRPFRAG